MNAYTAQDEATGRWFVRLGIVAVCLAIIAMALTAGGCASRQQRDDSKLGEVVQEIRDTRLAVTDSVKALETDLATLPVSDPVRLAAEPRVRRISTYLQLFDRYVNLFRPQPATRPVTTTQPAAALPLD